MSLYSSKTGLPPLIPPITEEETQQLATVCYFLIYHNECLGNIINDTMSKVLISLSSKFRDYHDEVLKSLIGSISDFNIANCTSSMILEKLKSSMGAYSLPFSIQSYPDFMKDANTVGQVLELMAQDWQSVRNELKSGTDQVVSLVTGIINCLREVYVNNPEYKYTVELLNTLQKCGIKPTVELRNYCQACVIASQIQVDSFSHGLLLTLILVPQSNSFFMIDQLKSDIFYMIPSINEAAAAEFHRTMNSIFNYFIADNEWTLCDYQCAILNRGLVAVAMQRAFRGIEVLLRETPIHQNIAALAQTGLLNLSKAVVCTEDNAKTCMAPMPTNIVEASELYDMVFTEKAHFGGKVTKTQKRRWGFNLANIKSYFESTHQVNHPMYEEDVLPLLSTILHM